MTNDSTPETNAQVAARAPASRTWPIQVMEEKHVRDAADAIGEEFRLSRSEVCGRALRIGLPLLLEQLRSERDALTSITR